LVDYILRGEGKAMSNAYEDRIENSIIETISRLAIRARSCSSLNINPLIKFNDTEKSKKLWKEFFKKEEIKYIAIDSSSSISERSGIVIINIYGVTYTGAASLINNVEWEEPRKTSSVNASITITLEEDLISNISPDLEFGLNELTSSLMRLTEYKLALDFVRTNEVSLILLDRSLSYDIMKTITSSSKISEEEEGDTTIIGISTPFGRLTKRDVEYALFNVSSKELEIPSRRFEKFYSYHKALNGEIIEKDEFLRGNNKEEIVNMRRRLIWVANQIMSNINSNNPMRLRDRILNSRHFDLASLQAIQELIRTSWNKRILAISISKDIGSSEISNVLSQTLGVRMPKGADRTTLYFYSLYNNLSTPWSTVEYDSAFKAAKNENGKIVIKEAPIPERLLVKSYFQLWASNEARSHVMSYERLAYPEFDRANPNVGNLILYNDKSSPIQDLVIYILSSMGREVIQEALGHNYPLFLADKEAKRNLEELNRHAESLVKYYATKLNLNFEMYYLSKFRDLRFNWERRRRE